jgi:hypothetical protein
MPVGRADGCSAVPGRLDWAPVKIDLSLDG